MSSIIGSARSKLMRLFPLWLREDLAECRQKKCFFFLAEMVRKLGWISLPATHLHLESLRITKENKSIIATICLRLLKKAKDEM